MTKNDMSEFQENAQQSYEEFMRQQEADPLAQQSDAIMGEVEPILRSYYPELPRHVALCYGAMARLWGISKDLYDDIIELIEAEGKDSIQRFEAIAGRKHSVHDALDSIQTVIMEIMTEYSQELKDRRRDGEISDE